jgi:hypothetical protein
MALPRRTVAELIALHAREPKLRNIFVEGFNDVSIYRWYISQAGITEVGVYEVETVDIPAITVLETTGLEDNSKSRVVTLASLLQNSGLTERQLICIVDADFDHLDARQWALRLLLTTDFSSVEMYLFDLDTLQKFAALYLKQPVDVVVLMRDCEEMLIDVFLFRDAKRKRFANAPHLTFDRCCKFEKGRLSLDIDEYLKRYLNKAARGNMYAQERKEIRERRKGLTGDLRCYMHGHDLVDALAVLSKKLLKASGATSTEAVAAGLCACAEYEKLKKYPLFKKLEGRLS